MPTKRNVLHHLTRDELLSVVDRFELVPPDRRAKEGIVETIAASKKATLVEVLATCGRSRLKELCRAVGLDDSGREKAVILERLVGAKPSQEAAPSARASSKAAPSAEDIAIAPGAKLTVDALERYLWSAADILRGSIDSSDYKVVA